MPAGRRSASIAMLQLGGLLCLLRKNTFFIAKARWTRSRWLKSLSGTILSRRRDYSLRKHTVKQGSRLLWWVGQSFQLFVVPTWSTVTCFNFVIYFFGLVADIETLTVLFAEWILWCTLQWHEIYLCKEMLLVIFQILDHTILILKNSYSLFSIFETLSPQSGIVFFFLPILSLWKCVFSILAICII